MEIHRSNLNLDERYWQDRYLNGQTGWDIGYASTPIREYFEQVPDKSAKILIPGAGNSYEAAYLWENGFQNTHVLDIAQQPLHNLKERVPDFPTSQLIKGNFFDHSPAAPYDLIVEQTFFCALPPSMRPQYAEKMHSLLKKSGKLVGLLFTFPLTEKGPPFGGDLAEYETYFAPHFNIKVMEKAYNSIDPRMGNELFIILEKT